MNLAKNFGMANKKHPIIHWCMVTCSDLETEARRNSHSSPAIYLASYTDRMYVAPRGRHHLIDLKGVYRGYDVAS